MTNKNYNRLIKAISDFWVDCGFCLGYEDDYEQSVAEIREQGDEIGILCTSIYDDEILGKEPYKEILPKERWLEVYICINTMSILKLVDGMPDWILFDDEESLISYMNNLTESDLVFKWSDEFIAKFKRRVENDNRNEVYAG